MDRTPETIEELGWKEGTVAEFLHLTPQESALIEIKLALGRHLLKRREQKMTQAQLAKKIHSSPTRIAKAETGHISIPIELLIQGILATGGTQQEIGKVLSKSVKLRVSNKGNSNPGKIDLKTKCVGALI